MAEQTKKQIFSNLRHPAPAKGYSCPMPSGISTWKRMRGNPTIAMARMAATSPILLQGLALDSKDDAPEAAVVYVQDYIKPLVSKLIKDLLLALDFGYSAFEMIWGVKQSYFVPLKIKYLDPSMTVIEQDDNGKYLGITQQEVFLPEDATMLYTYNLEGDNLYGNPRSENARLAWSQWLDLVDLEGVYIQRVTNILPMVSYPSDESFETEDGEKVSAHDAAVEIVENLKSLNGVVIPQSTMGKQAQALINAGIDPAQLKPWTLEFAEADGKHGDELTEALRRKEVQMCRAWLMPERAILEGVHGTLAEAESQGIIGQNASQLVMNDILDVINKQLVAPALSYNFGDQHADSVKFSATQVKPEMFKFLSDLVLKAVDSPEKYNVLQTIIDIDAVADLLNLPKQEEVL